MGPKFTYSQAVEYLASLEGRGWRLGLDRMLELIQRAGLLDALGTTSPKFIHVAGTNGKGTVTAMIQSCLACSGYQVGGYFSPYVHSIRERVQLNCQLISEQDFAEGISFLAEIVPQFSDSTFGEITEFECKTALGFWFWKKSKCDFVALEVGMGGRLDATNVVHPVCSVITSIGLDHTAYLGTTHAEIAAEKAGIIKPGIPVVVGKVSEEAEHAIRKVASSQNSPCFVFGKELVPGSIAGISTINNWFLDEMFQFGIQGQHSMENAWLTAAAIALSKVPMSEQQWKRGIAQATLPGRLERRQLSGVEIILDGAHNAEAAESLAASLADEDCPIVLVSSMLEGHDPRPFYRWVQKLSSSIHIPPINFHRARQPKDVASEISDLFENACCHKSVESALDAALKEAILIGGKVLVTGSFYLVGEVGNLIPNHEVLE